MGKLAKQLLAAREVEVAVGELVFVVRRPDALRSMGMSRLDGNALAEMILSECVVGWKNVLERDILGAGGSDQALDFDREDFVTWARDKPEIWRPIVDSIVETMNTWASRLAESRKN